MESIICDMISRMSATRINGEGIYNHAWKNTLDLGCEVEFRRLADNIARAYNSSVVSYNPHKFSFRPNNQLVEVIVRWNYDYDDEEALFKIVVEAVSV
jgi:hypothetical protein